MRTPVPLHSSQQMAVKLDAALVLELMDTIVGKRYQVPVHRGPRLRLPPAPGAPDPSDPEAVEAWVMADGRPTAIDLFCGAGGLSLGLHNAGFRVLVGADSDALAVETHTANLGGLGYTGDLADPADLLRTLRAWGITRVDLLAGGVPCQPFSRAGQSKIRSLVAVRARPERDQRADLWQSFVEVVRYLHPRAVLLENVPDLAEWEDGTVLVGFCESLRDLGYTTQARVLNAYDHGVPQHRSRLFIVGIRSDEPRYIEWPDPHPDRPSLWDAISDLPEVPPAQRMESLPYEGPKTELQRRLRIGVACHATEVVWDHITRDVRPDDREAFALLPEGGTYVDLPERLRRYRSDIFKDKYKRLSRHLLSRTITAHVAKDGYWYIHPTQDRTLSVREAARIQTFPDWFRFAGEPSHRYRQIGNAVPPMLAEALGHSLMQSLRGMIRRIQPSDSEAIRRSLVTWSSQQDDTPTWRRGRNPWAVLVGELWLRQLPTKRREEAFAGILATLPSVEQAAQNPTAARELFTAYGLTARVDELIDVTHAVVAGFGGEIPFRRQDLMSVPHIGDYVASAVLCFGFGRPAILMDAATVRVVRRLRGMSREPRRWQVRLELHALAGKSGPNDTFNAALLDLGTSICRSSGPLCSKCPIRSDCATGGGAE